MIIVGLNAFHADSSAAILVNGRLVAAIEEERFTRVKHWAGFPVQALNFCLQQADVRFEDVDYFTIGRNPGAKIAKKLIYLTANAGGSLKAVRSRLANRKSVNSLEQHLSAISGLPAKYFKGRIKQVEHHRSHIASAFFASPFHEAACLSIDGSGDFSTTMTAIGLESKVSVLDSVDFPHSLGLFYTAFTQLLGFPFYGDEYKVMGMAPYGKPVYARKLRNVIELTNDGFFKLKTSYFRKGTEGFISYADDHLPTIEPLFNKNLIEEFGVPRRKGEALSAYHKDLAASVQKITEETLFHILTALHRRTGMKNLCIAGGVAQNSVANGKISLNTPFKNIYIPSASHDAGIAMGAALHVQHHMKNAKRQPPVFSAFTGSCYSNRQIKEYLNRSSLKYRELSDAEVFDKASDCIINGKVVGWFTGRAEFGPRALGGRSILADPRRKDAKDIINRKIKRRESFRPFAPSVLKEFVSEFFEQNETVPFMEKVLVIKQEKRKDIPAVTHVDGTGRLQTVDRKISPRFYALIETFFKKTGVPVLLNTSFNENEPIVNTPEEAVDCFLRTDMDLLVLENIVLEKECSDNKDC